jgi:hypothetical protein
MAHDVLKHGPDDYRPIAAVTLAWLYCCSEDPAATPWIERATSMARQYQGLGSEILCVLAERLQPNCAEPLFVQGLFHALAATSQEEGSARYETIYHTDRKDVR